MSKDMETNIAAAIMALAAIIKGVLGYFKVQIDFSQEFLSAIITVCVLYAMWKIGKSGNNTTVGQDQLTTGGQPKVG